MSPEQFANAKSDSRHHGSSTKITRVVLQSKKNSEVQLIKYQISYWFPKSQQKIMINKFLLHNTSDIPNSSAVLKKKREANHGKLPMLTYHKETGKLFNYASIFIWRNAPRSTLASLWWSVIFQPGLENLAFLSFGFDIQKTWTQWFGLCTH